MAPPVFIADGGMSVASGIITVSQASGARKGDLNIVNMIAQMSSSNLPSAPTGWTVLRYGWLYGKVVHAVLAKVSVADGSGTLFTWGGGGVLHFPALPSGCHGYRSAAGGSWQLASAMGVDNTDNGTFSAGADLGALQVDDLIFMSAAGLANAAYGTPGWDALTPSPLPMTCGGATLGTLTSRETRSPGGYGGVDGGVGGAGATTCPVTGAGAGSMASTFRVDQAGGAHGLGEAVWVRIREVPQSNLTEPHYPIIALVSPANPGSIAPGDTITIDVTDADGDLSVVAITANGEAVYTGGAFTSTYSASSVRSDITNGWRFAITRTGGWDAGSLTIYAVGTDVGARTGSGAFTWTVTAPTVHAPAIAVHSPVASALDKYDEISFDVTDEDDNLASVTIVINGETAYTGGAWTTNYLITGTGTSVITHGIRYTAKRSGGWQYSYLAATVTATDNTSLTTTESFGWSVTGLGITTQGVSLPRLERRITVPAGGWSVSLTDGDGTNSVTIPAGYYYMSSTAPTGTRSFLAQVATTLGGGTGVTYTCTIDAATDTATGQVTIAASEGTWSISWTSTALRDLLGFTGATTSSSGASATGTAQAKSVWLPNVQRTPETPDPIGGESAMDFGRPETDYLLALSPSGAMAPSVFSSRRLDKLVFDNAHGRKMWRSNEQTTNESLETWWSDLMAAGAPPFRYHPSRADDATYYTENLDSDCASLHPAPLVPGWVGPLSLWRVELGVRKHVLVSGI